MLSFTFFAVRFLGKVLTVKRNLLSIAQYTHLNENMMSKIYAKVFRLKYRQLQHTQDR